MEPNTLSVETLAERVEKLERQNRKLKGIGATILILAATVVLMGQAPGTRTVEANEFVLKDSTGKVRGRFSIFGENTHMQLFDANGQLRSFMHVGGLTLYDGSGKARVAIITGADETILEVYGPNGETVTVGASSVDDEAGFLVSDAEGFQTRIGKASLVTPRTGETHRTSAASVLLFDKEKKVLWKAP